MSERLLKRYGQLVFDDCVRIGYFGMVSVIRVASEVPILSQHKEENVPLASSLQGEIGLSHAELNFELRLDCQNPSWLGFG